MPSELAERSKVDLLGDTSYVLRNAGESERAIALIDEAISLCDQADVAPYALLLRNKASYLANIGQVGSIELLREALAVLEGQPRSVLRANVLGELAARLMLDRPLRRGDRDGRRGIRRGHGGRQSGADVGGIQHPRVLTIGRRRHRGRTRRSRARRRVRGRQRLGSPPLLGQSVRRPESRRPLRRGGAHRRRGRRAREAARCGAHFRGHAAVERDQPALRARPDGSRRRDARSRTRARRARSASARRLRRLKVQAALWSGDRALAERLLRGWRGSLRLQGRDGCAGRARHRPRER